MELELISDFLHFSLNPKNSSWSLSDINLDGPSLEEISMRVSYLSRLESRFLTGKGRFVLLERWDTANIAEVYQVSSPHGLLNCLKVDFGPDSNGIHCQIRFFLSVEQPLFFWNLEMENYGKKPIEIERIEMLRAGSKVNPRSKVVSKLFPSIGKTSQLSRGIVRPNQDPGELGFFSNGWQSWSYSGTYFANDTFRASRLGSLANPIWYQDGKKPRKQTGLFTSDMFGVLSDLKYRTGILAGFLSQKEHFGSLQVSISDRYSPYMCLSADGDHALLNPGTKTSSDWAVIQFVDLDEPRPLDIYLDAVASQHQLTSGKIKGRPPIGWCSWYQFFKDIDDQKIRRNLKSAADLQQSVPLSIVQIDDGFETRVGDWFEFKPEFPEGVASIADEIEENDFTPGLWLAPFILHGRSKVAQNHPNWILRNRFGLPVNAGFQWNSLTKALDLSHPEVVQHIRNLITTVVHDWGFKYLKLDFLYAAALNGRHYDRTKTRAQVLREGLELIREAAGPETILLGCGVPLGPSIGVFDVMRIGADVAPHWGPKLIVPNFIIRKEPNLPSIRNALQNILSRSILHHRWWINDPDCLIIRSDSSLSLVEVQTLATAIAMTGGSLFLSDDLPMLSKDRIRMVQKLIPLLDRRPRVLDWFESSTPKLLRVDLENQTGKWYLLAVFNWSSKAGDQHYSFGKLDLSFGNYFAREFWSGEVSQIADNRISIRNIPAHGVKLIALTPISSQNQVDEKIPHYLGGDLHISQGLEVKKWSISASGYVDMELNRPFQSRGIFDLFLPEEPAQLSIDGGKIRWEQMKDHLFRFHISMDKSAKIRIVYKSIVTLNQHS